MEKKYKVLFRYEPPIAGEHRVFVAGSFNGWRQDEFELLPRSGLYSCTLPLLAGRWEYKFIVDGRWMADETAELFADDGQGGRNSVVEVGMDGEVLYRVVLQCRPPQKVNRLFVAGDFNLWHPAQDRLLPQTDGSYALTLLLRAGSYQYKFMANDSWWVPDNLKTYKPFGNAALTVKGNSRRWHPGSSELLCYGLYGQYPPCAMEVGSDILRIQCRVWRGNAIRVRVCTPQGAWSLVLEYQDANYDYWAVHISGESVSQWYLQMDGETQTRYLFEDGAAVEARGKPFGVSKRSQPLSWLQQGIFYQIFCDRFANGDASLNPDFSEWYYQLPQGELAEEVRHQHFWFQPAWQDASVLTNHPQRYFVFYGGDLAGVLQKLDYLIELGITAIYFNPLVQAASNHKYDAVDFMQIDPHFGGNDAFKAVVTACHAAGIRVILDFAFNHVGVGFFAFQDCLKNGVKSRYFNWFDWYRFPLPSPIPDDFKATDYYQCWWGHATLPDLNFDLSRLHPEENYIADEKDAVVNEPLVQYLLEVAEFWVRDMQIDGFRLDVPNEVPFWFWKRFRSRVKSLNPACYLVGEIWHNANEWIGQYFDGVMNYSFFREPVLQCIGLGNWSVERLAATLFQGLRQYGFTAASLMMNLLDSHDTYRFLQASDGDVRRLICAVMLQMTWVGVPHLYYGDEIAMEGGGDPDNRRPMNWQWQQDKRAVALHESIRQLIALRRAHPCLVYGEVRLIKAAGGMLVYSRRLARQEFTIYLNLSDEVRSVDIMGEIVFCSAEQKQPSTATLELPEWSGVVIST